RASRVHDCRRVSLRGQSVNRLLYRATSTRRTDAPVRGRVQADTSNGLGPGAVLPRRSQMMKQSPWRSRHRALRPMADRERHWRRVAAWEARPLREVGLAIAG